MKNRRKLDGYVNSSKITMTNETISVSTAVLRWRAGEFLPSSLEGLKVGRTNLLAVSPVSQESKRVFWSIGDGVSITVLYFKIAGAGTRNRMGCEGPTT